MKKSIKIGAVIFRVATLSSVLLLVGCGPSKWDILKESETQNQADINAHCYSTLPNATLCAQAQREETALDATRAQYVKEAQEACERAWTKYDRDIANYDRKLAEYDREVDRHEREKDRKSRECERERDRYDRAMDRYQRCLDRQSTSSSTYSYCSIPTYPWCLSSLSIGPTKPTTPWRPWCTR